MPDASGKALPGEPGYVPPSTDFSAMQPGLINTTPGLSTVTPGTSIIGYTPAIANATQATGVGYAATPFDVAPNQTVSDQIRGIIDKNSPLMQQALTRANQQMARRGTLNSSLAIGAGQSAVTAAALPIAQADAATYAQAARDTANAQNAAAQFEAAAKNTASGTNAQLRTNTAQFNANSANTALGASATAANQTGLQSAQINSQEKLQAMQSNTQLTIADKQAATQKYLADTENAMKKTLADIQANTTLTVTEKNNESQRAIAAADNATRIALENIQSNTSLSIADKQALTQTILNERDNNTKLRLQDMQLQGDIAKIRENSIAAQALSRLDNSYRVLIQSSVNASEIYRQGMANAAAILTNPNITDKDGALNIVMAQTDDALKLIGGMGNLNLGTTLTFTDGSAAPATGGSGTRTSAPATTAPATTAPATTAPATTAPATTAPATTAAPNTGGGLGAGGSYTSQLGTPTTFLNEGARGVPTVPRISVTPSIINPVNTNVTDPNQYLSRSTPQGTAPAGTPGTPAAQTNPAIQPGTVNAQSMQPQDWMYYVNHPETWKLITGDSQFISQMINAYGPGGRYYNPDNTALRGYNGVFAAR